MTPEEWNAVAAEVAEGILEAGTTAQIQAPGTRSGPEDNPTVTPAPWQDVLVVYSEWNGTQIDGTLIKATDQQVLVAAQGVEPQTDWKFRESPTGPAKHIVPPLQKVAPAGVAVLYILNVRD